MARRISEIAQVVALMSALAMLGTALIWLGEIKRTFNIIEEIQMGRRIFMLEAEVALIKERLGIQRTQRDHFGE